jgi:DNA-binding LacI/PurR family transcriptional regulator
LITNPNLRARALRALGQFRLFGPDLLRRVRAVEPLDQQRRVEVLDWDESAPRHPDGGPPPFTAVLCGTDQMAAGVLEGLRERGLRCPQDVSVTGFDDIPGARDLNPALTTVRVPYEEMGALAVRMALQEGSGEHLKTLPVEVIERDSVGAPRG